jgi:ankyrin repeat protein
MKLLRTIVLIGLAVSWGDRGWAIKEAAEELYSKASAALKAKTDELGKEAKKFYKSKQSKQTPAAKTLPQQQPNTSQEATQIPQQAFQNDLFEAAKHGNAAVVKYNLLLNSKADIEMPLTFAAMHGYTNVLDALISIAQITPQQYLDTLCTAAQYGQLDIVKKILQNFKRDSGVKKFVKGLFTDPNLPSTQPVTPLMEACRYAHPQIVYELLKSGEKNTINNRDSTGMTALIWACKTMYKMPDPMAMAEIVSQLINAGADVNVQDNTGWTALMYAVGRNCSGAVQELLNADSIKIDSKSKEGSTALNIAKALTSNLKNEFALAENAKIINLLENAASK